MNDGATLEKYVGVFGRLKRNAAAGHGSAPHKPILLLALFDEIEAGAYQDDFIVLTAELVAAFQAYWKALVHDSYWKPRIEYPFRHLYQDGFWHFAVDDQIIAPEPKRSYTIHQLRSDFDGVRLTPDLWLLLQDGAARDALRQYLLKSYFQVGAVKRESTEALLYAEAERLKAEAQGAFRVRKVKEPTDAGYFVRHALFPRVIKELYKGTCCVCRTSARVPEKAGIVDAAHILPFAEFHNDNPRNGLALCKNHHWGFDAGWFTVTEDYTVSVSPRLRDAAGYIVAEKRILLPDNRTYAPDPAALKWHRENRLVR